MSNAELHPRGKFVGTMGGRVVLTDELVPGASTFIYRPAVDHLTKDARARVLALRWIERQSR